MALSSQTIIHKNISTALIILGALLLSSAALAKDPSKLIRLATTTSTENSGLLNNILPHFEKNSGYKIHTIAVGTGKAIRMGRDGDVDVLLVHAKNAEEIFIKDGYGVERFPVMYNDFVIVGPVEDMPLLENVKTASEALEKIALAKKRFISRGDDSGTHKKEIGLWKYSNVMPDSNKHSWYLEAGQGMGKVLQMAGEMNAFTLADRGTWLAYTGKSPLKILFEGDENLFNPYGVIAVNPKKHPDVNYKGAQALIEWMTSKNGQHLIGQFKIAGKTLFKPSASSVASK